MSFSHRDFSARLEEANQQINAELLDFLNTQLLTEVEAAVSAARDEAQSGQPTKDTLLRIAEAAATAKSLLESATKFTAVQASQTGASLRDAASSAGVSPSALTRWIAQDEDVELPPQGVWWTTAADMAADSEEPSGVDAADSAGEDHAGEWGDHPAEPDVDVAEASADTEPSPEQLSGPQPEPQTPRTSTYTTGNVF